jgi:hypothetical protein
MRYLDIDTATKISKIGLDTWQFGAGEWGYGKPYAEQEARAIVRCALELGVTLFDIELADDESQALTGAAARFRPVTGTAALPGVLRARLRRLPAPVHRRRTRGRPRRARGTTPWSGRCPG